MLVVNGFISVPLFLLFSFVLASDSIVEQDLMRLEDQELLRGSNLHLQSSIFDSVSGQDSLQ